MANFIAEEDVVGVLPSADIDEPKSHVRFACEGRDAFTQEEVANQQMDLINQIVRQQIVPESPAPRNQNIFTRLAFKYRKTL